MRSLRLLTGFLAAGSVVAGERIIRLRDHINHDWSGELLSYSLRFRPGECHPSTLELVGPDGPQACQPTDLWADGAGRAESFRLWFVTSLSARGEKTFRLRYGPEPTTGTRVPDAGLVVTREGHHVAFTTPRTGVRVLCGTRNYVPPVPACDVPGPIAAMRLLDGTWFGGSALYGNHRVTACSAEVTAAGPVFAEGCVTYSYEDAPDLVVSVRVVSGQAGVFVGTDSKSHRPEEGWQLNLTEGYPEPILMARGMHASHPRWVIPRGTIGGVPLDREPAGPLCTVVPWMHQAGATGSKEVYVLRSAHRGTATSVGSHDPAAWIDPAWSRRDDLPELRKMLWEYKGLPLIKGDDGSLLVDSSAAIGRRKWFIGFVPKADDPVQTYLDAASLRDSRYGCQTLDTVEDYVLEWEPGPGAYWPRLYFPRDDAPSARRQLGNVARLEGHAGGTRRAYRAETGERVTIEGRALIQHMVDSAFMTPRYNMTLENNYNEFDVLRHSGLVIHLFDALMGTGELSNEEEKLLRAQMAFLGYRLHDPHFYDVSRGYAVGGNMHLSFVSWRGLVACAIPGHPLAKEWATQALAVVNERVDGMIGENGVWVNENMHYANVSLSSVLPFYMAMRNAGFYDFTENEKLRAWVLYIVKQLTPRDPRYEDTRSQPPEQLRYRAFRTALAGVMAKATARTHPDYARALQWAWNEQGNAEGIPDSRFGVFGDCLRDTALEAAQPVWRSEHFPKASAVLRHGLGSPHEYYLMLPLCQFGDYYQPQPGGVTVYGKGKPLALVFSGVYEVYTAEAFLTNSVSMARSPAKSRAAGLKGCVGPGRIAAFSGMPRQDYAAAEFLLNRPYTKMPEKQPALPPWPRLLREASPGELAWKRQVLFIKGASARDAGYFLFRDTVSGGQPTVWSMWTLSEKIGTPGEARDLRGFRADAPGNRVAATRPLPGDRFTAIGQFDVDVEYYVALPRDTPRATVRWGYSTTGHWPNPWHEYQDLLHLQRPDDGDYFVAFYPRRRDEPAPKFSSSADGLIIKTEGEFGTDYGFLCADASCAETAQVSFTGTAASVQDRGTSLALSLGAGGEVRYGEYGLSSPSAASLVLDGGRLTVCASHDRKGDQMVVLHLPAGLTLSPDRQDAAPKNTGPGTHEILLPRGQTTVGLRVRGP